ncbi:RND family efflux transporter MFP subunit [Gloeobacter kilaueensis JS1]|uniref:RND family efflux transporter MFP subunit n=1 Tax=Gloeobacter kilaueensis (strain ATCC BAA-2537 / CCAP 1431/1 / ULC 316 / JS1) TaxID=1183438 RepID=U5QPC7_GLOK1|nr:RND family efflux transporter MFP subunit [Gloeobacter kilaueensis JS1]
MIVSKSLTGGTIVGVLALLLGACGHSEVSDQSQQQVAIAATSGQVAAGQPEGAIELSAEAVRNQGIQVQTVARRRLLERKVFPASIEEAANRSGTVSMPVSSRVQQINVDIGDSVDRGQVLAVLTSSELGTAKADLLSAKSRLLASQARLIAARRQSERESYLFGRGISSEREKQEAQAQLASAQADFAAAQAAIDAAKARLLAFGMTNQEINQGDITPRLYARSATDGRIIQRKARVGQVVQPGEALFSISDLSEVWVVLKVFQSELGRLRVGDSVRFTVRGLSNRDVNGRVVRISEALDPQTRTADVRVVIPNRGRQLKPGMLVQAEVDLGSASREVLAIPDKALYEVAGKQIVFVRESATRFRPRSVTVGSRAGQYVEVRSGLKPGDAIVVEGGFVLKSELLKS